MELIFFVVVPFVGGPLGGRVGRVVAVAVADAGGAASTVASLLVGGGGGSSAEADSATITTGDAAGTGGCGA